MEPQINADERRYYLNNELARTETNSGHSVYQYYSISVIKEVRI